MDDGGGLKAAYRGGCGACQDLSRCGSASDAGPHCRTRKYLQLFGKRGSGRGSNRRRSGPSYVKLQRKVEDLARIYRGRTLDADLQTMPPLAKPNRLRMCAGRLIRPFAVVMKWHDRRHMSRPLGGTIVHLMQRVAPRRMEFAERSISRRLITVGLSG